jgi:hypothetical protein
MRATEKRSKIISLLSVAPSFSISTVDLELDAMIYEKRTWVQQC